VSNSLSVGLATGGSILIAASGMLTFYLFYKRRKARRDTKHAADKLESAQQPTQDHNGFADLGALQKSSSVEAHVFGDSPGDFSPPATAYLNPPSRDPWDKYIGKLSTDEPEASSHREHSEELPLSDDDFVDDISSFSADSINPDDNFFGFRER
jgi:hypothetical protein